MKPRVLIVEDELITAIEFKEALLNADFEVPVVADRISKAKNAFESMNFDLILLDITLKYDDATGLDFAEYVRKLSNIPIMFITGDSNEILLEKMKIIGNCNYMMKIVRPNEMVFKVKLMIGNKNHEELKNAKYQEVILLPINKSQQKIRKSDIVAIKGNGSYSDIFIANEHHYHTLSMNMKKLLEGLDYPDFFRLNRSNVININFIDKIEGEYLYLLYHKLKIRLKKGQKTEIKTLLSSIKTK